MQTEMSLHEKGVICRPLRGLIALREKWWHHEEGVIWRLHSEEAGWFVTSERPAPYPFYTVARGVLRHDSTVFLRSPLFSADHENHSIAATGTIIGIQVLKKNDSGSEQEAGNVLPDLPKAGLLSTRSREMTFGKLTGQSGSTNRVSTLSV